MKSVTMPKVIPVPDDVSKPFWDAVNEKRLVLQNCGECDQLQYPPRPRCSMCGSADSLEWRAVEGKGRISACIVVEDGRLERRMADMPYNIALITLDQDPGINFYSNLPGVEPYKAPIGAPVNVTFEEVAPGQLIHEWLVES